MNYSFHAGAEQDPNPHHHTTAKAFPSTIITNLCGTGQDVITINL